jgi:hypothetical protein
VPRGIWGFVSAKWGWSLLPIGYRVRKRDKISK